MDNFGNPDETDRLIMRMRGKVPSRDMSEILGIHESTVLTRIQRLIRRGHMTAFMPGERQGAPRHKTSRKCLACGSQFVAADAPKIRRICDMCRKNPDRVCG